MYGREQSIDASVDHTGSGIERQSKACEILLLPAQICEDIYLASVALA